MRLWKTLISCVAVTAVTAVSEVARAQQCPPPTGQTSYNKLKIINNFTGAPNGTEYFGKVVPDTSIWLYLAVEGPTNSPYVVYIGGKPSPNTPKMVYHEWKNFGTEIKGVGDGCLYVPFGADKGRIVAVIYGDTSPPDALGIDAAGAPVIPGGGFSNPPCDLKSYAYGFLEYTTSASDPNCDISFVDQFSFPQRLTVYQADSTTVRGSNGFATGVTAQEYLEEILSEKYLYANGNNSFHYPSNMGRDYCGNSIPALPDSFTGLNNPVKCQNNVGRLIAECQTGNLNATGAYRVVAPNNAAINTVIATDSSGNETGSKFNVLQCPGQFQELLDKLYNDPQNQEGYLFASSQNYGYTFRLKITKPATNAQGCAASPSDPLGAGAPTFGLLTSPTVGYGLMLTDFIEYASGQPDGKNCLNDNWGQPFKNPTTGGISVAGSLYIAADGVPFPGGTLTNNKTCPTTGEPDQNDFPTYGLWTTACLLTGAFPQNQTIDTAYGNFSAFPQKSLCWPEVTTCDGIYKRTGTAVLDDAAFGPDGMVHVWPGTDQCGGGATGRFYPAILANAIGRVSTAFSYGMAMTDQGWNQGGGVGFAYISRAASATSRPVATSTTNLPNNIGGSCQGATLNCNKVDRCLSIPAYPFGCQDTAFFQLGKSSANPLMSRPPNVYFGSPWILVSEKFTETSTGSSYTVTPPYIAAYSDNFNGVFCTSQANMMSPDVPLLACDSFTWELGLPAESPPACCNVSSDINGDGGVNGDDLAILVGAWGNENCPTTDLDGNGITAGEDLGLLIENWSVGDPPHCPANNMPDWAIDLASDPDATKLCPPTGLLPSVLRDAIVETGLPWQVTDRFTNMKMVLIPPGTFNMGCSASQSYGCDSDESPVHQVTLTKAFYLGVYEVTQGQWSAVMSNNPSTFQGSRYPNSTFQPVESVTYLDVQSWFTTVNQGVNANYRPMRLPTEAEWEWAYRAGTSTAFHAYSGNPGNTSGTNADSDLPIIAWYGGNAINQTLQVGLKKSNGFGLHDMSGNVWEFVSDWFGRYPVGPSDDPTGATGGSNRVFRGGGWNSSSGDCRASVRNSLVPNNAFSTVGFRVARDAH